MSKALIAMSGGVDSSVCAALILKRGFDAAGGTMRLFCASKQDADDAKAVCDRLGIEHFTFDMSDLFEKEVIQKFVAAYETGLTPNPCVICNKAVKFGALLKKADELGCSHIATGHYARVEKSGGQFLLKRALDISKDQSYVLYSLTQDQLSRIILPLGEFSKPEVREIAKEYGFSNSEKKDSQDICFIPDGDYAGFIERYTGKTYPQGDFADEDGNILGTHRGIIRYTIGQRRGLGLALPAPLYVKEKDVKTNRVTLAPNDSLYTDRLKAKNFNMVMCEIPPDSFTADVKTRYNAKPARARITLISEDEIMCEFENPQRAVTPGQAAVLYDGDTVIGGGTIV